MYRPSRAIALFTISASDSPARAISAPSVPGPWLRLSAVAAVAATAVVVATGEWARTHEAAVLGALVLLVAVAAQAWLGHRDVPHLVHATVGAVWIFLLQIAMGGLVAWSDAASWATGIHIGLGAVAVATSAVAAALTFRPALGPARPLPWRDYLTLTKPRIMVLLLVTAAAGTFVGAQGVPSAGLLLTVLGGLALACGGASALNHLIDRDIDQHMKRTDRRPVATGRVAPERALEFGLALSAFSFVVLASFANTLTAALAVFGNLFYVVVYTRFLKRTTPQNIVIGGAAGAVPAVVGYAAATGNLALPALFLFLIVFYWTPPHFWALALLIRREYEAAHVPMLPVVRGDSRTARSIFRYTLLMIGITLLPVLTGDLRWLYLGAAVALGLVFLCLSAALLRGATPARARRLFHYSLLYLALLFVAMAIDPIAFAG
jgi:protoheme IX farnesyltransferase